jgi:hypothetical protein
MFDTHDPHYVSSTKTLSKFDNGAPSKVVLHYSQY